MLSLRKKTLLVIAATLLGSSGATYAISSRALLRNARLAEERDAERATRVALNIIGQYQDAFTERLAPWSQWNDMSAYLRGGGEAFIESNLADNFLTYARIDMVALADVSGKVQWSTLFDARTARRSPLTKEIAEHVRVGNLLFGPDAAVKSARSGILMLPEGPMMVSAFACADSRGLPPIAGTLLSGRYLTRADVDELARPAGLSVEVLPLNSPSLPADSREAQWRLSEASPIVVRAQSDERIVGYAQLSDVYGRPALLVRVEQERTIYAAGKKRLLYLVMATALAGLVFGGVTLLLLEKLLLSRLTRLRGDVAKLGKDGDLSRRVEAQGDDELSRLSLAMNRMLEALDENERERREAHEALRRAAELSEVAHQRSDRLLLNILPRPVAERLKQDQTSIAEHFEETSILFADIVNFTSLAGKLSPTRLVGILDRIFTAFDAIADKHGLEKIKTIGDAYMVVGGVPVPRSDHAEAVAAMALEMRRAIRALAVEEGEQFDVRIGINTGPAVAGVIGKKKFSYDLWGDAVNVASRMEASGEPGKIQVTEATYERLKDSYSFERRGMIDVKGKGSMVTYWLVGE